MDVGVPTYGRPAFVAEAVESVLAQSMPDWRLTISEDGPGSDAVKAAIDPYLGDERVSYVATGERVGSAANMSRLIQTGTAPYVIVLHDDDVWEPDVLARRARFLDEHPECGFVFSGHFDIDADGRRTGRSDLALDEGVHAPATLAPMMLTQNVADVPAAVMVRREAYEQVGAAFDESFPRIYDWEMWARLALRFDAGYLAVRDVGYRRHAQQISRAGGQGREFLRLYEQLEEALVRVDPSLRPPPRESARRRARLLVACALDSAAEGDRSAARDALRRARGLDRRIVVNPRFGAALLSVHGGRPARALTGALRRASYRRGDRPDQPGAAP